jgi:hypothetical protein
VPGWTVHAADIMHFVVTQFRYLMVTQFGYPMGSCRCFPAFMEAVLRCLALEAEELGRLRWAATSVAGAMSGAPGRKHAPLPAWPSSEDGAVGFGVCE